MNRIKTPGIDPLFQRTEAMAADFSLFPNSPDISLQGQLPGLLSERQITKRVAALRQLDADRYVAEVVFPASRKNRPDARAVVLEMGGVLLREWEHGPLYAAELEVDVRGEGRRIGILAQNRSGNNGVWQPQHHLMARTIIREFATLNLPVVTLIDTPGADAGEQANLANQAHAISRLITEVMLLEVPVISVILGNGYSGGAIPLAAGNVLLSVRDGVFNTIQPPGLASIARRYQLSWQECARYVGVSPHELYQQGNIDGIIDMVPGENATSAQRLRQAIEGAIGTVEEMAVRFVTENETDIFEHYRRNVRRYVTPSPFLTELSADADLSQAQSPTAHTGIFGVAFRYLRYLGLRRRLRFITRDQYGRLSNVEIPPGDLVERRRRENQAAFEKWLNAPLALRYDDTLRRAWKQFAERRDSLDAPRGRIATFFMGSRQSNYTRLLHTLTLTYAFYLYNYWKDAAPHHFQALIDYLRSPQDSAATTVTTILDVLQDPDVREPFIAEAENLLVFDRLYNAVLADMTSIAGEAKESNALSRESVGKLLSGCLKKATGEHADEEKDGEDAGVRFQEWLHFLALQPRRGEILKSVTEWKKIAFPRISEALFAFVTFFFDHLLPAYLRAEADPRRRFDGRIRPRNIGVKDFWNRLDIAYRDLLIGDCLQKFREQQRPTPEQILTLFSDIELLDQELMSGDPSGFPGFRLALDQTLEKGGTPCGVETALGTFQYRNKRQRVGLIVSNLRFQAGAFDMASAEKFCRLLRLCAERCLPVIGFISSGGMQTKEGAGALFSMPIVNDRITRFIRDHELPIILFGFGHCTGGAQASMVTHPLVHTFYFSGANIPFAGQIVVPSHLPLTATLSNYLSRVPGSMQGLVRHPFAEHLDKELRRIDPEIPVGSKTVQQVLAQILKGKSRLNVGDAADQLPVLPELKSLAQPIKKLLIHARGCTAVKILRAAQARQLPVVLVQSDPDMDSVPAAMLHSRDTLVCLGGNTPDESYLNALSVIRIAEREKVDALHPGIGFLSESADFSALCRRHGINFVGPSAHSMERMGNKSNAISTALKLKVPVVPGSHGIVTSPDAAVAIAERIGYPVMIKAVHGGGGKGICLVERAEDFRAAFLRIGTEARNAFGNGDLYLEKCIVDFRHIEVQILRDYAGTVQVLGLRDCSVQRNNQKLIEESGSTLLPETLHRQACDYAAALAAEIEYTGAGTVEFLFDLTDQKIYFMEMNTRLQVEHPVTEMTSGVDIVSAQLDIAGGGSIAELRPRQEGYAMEARINAERMERNADGQLVFLPDPGEVTQSEFPEEDGVLIIAGVAAGKRVSLYYDSMIAQVICYGSDRQDTINRLHDYLGRVRIQGVCTNLALTRHILKDSVFTAGDYNTRYLPEFLERADVDSIISEIETAAGNERGNLNLDAIRVPDADELKVLAPCDGIFYLRPNPDEPEFVQEGTIVHTGQTLCLIEAMKLFRPISLALFNQHGELYQTDQSYQIQRINPADAQPVSRNDLLFVVKPIPRKET